MTDQTGTYGQQQAGVTAGWDPRVTADPVYRGAFDRQTSGLVGQVVLGIVLTVITLGFYRFKYTADLRRQLWMRSSLGGARFEYTGTAMELFIGFLMLIGIMIPLYGLSFLGTLQMGAVSIAASIAAPLGFMFLFLIAIFRARRFRLSRTLFRGIRFGQSGSAFKYALMSIGWGLATLLTLGIVFPAMRASLERYRVNNTWYGDRAFTSEARAQWRNWLCLYLFIVLLVAGGAVLAVSRLEGLIGELEARGSEAFVGAGMMLAGTGWLAASLLWPLYRAAELRAFIRLARLGDVRFVSTFSARSIYASWLLQIPYFLIGGFILGWAMQNLASEAIRVPMSEPPGVATAIVVASYVIFYILFAIGHTLHSNIRLWRAAVDSISAQGLEDIRTIRNRTPDGSAIGDDFASSYDFGGI